MMLCSTQHLRLLGFAHDEWHLSSYAFIIIHSPRPCVWPSFIIILCSLISTDSGKDALLYTDTTLSMVCINFGICFLIYIATYHHYNLTQLTTGVDKLQWKSLIKLVHDCGVYSGNIGELKWSGGWSTGTVGWLSASERGQYLAGWPAMRGDPRWILSAWFHFHSCQTW